MRVVRIAACAAFAIALAACGLETTTSEEAAQPLTAETNEDLAALLAGPVQGIEVSQFSDDYRLKSIEFDGYVENVWNKDVAQDDVITRAGSPESPTGPRFHIGAIDGTEEAVLIEGLTPGESVHVKADVGIYHHYNAEDTLAGPTDLMMLSLVGEIARN